MDYMKRNTGNSRNYHVVLYKLCQQLQSAEMELEEPNHSDYVEKYIHVNELTKARIQASIFSILW